MPKGDRLPPWIVSAGEHAWRLLIYVQPGAKKSEIAGEMDGRLRLRIAAQAVDNKANKALAAFVAKILGVRPRNVSLENGDTSRHKTPLVTEISQTDLMAKLALPASGEAPSGRE